MNDCSTADLCIKETIQFTGIYLIEDTLKDDKITFSESCDLSLISSYGAETFLNPSKFEGWTLDLTRRTNYLYSNQSEGPTIYSFVNADVTLDYFWKLLLPVNTEFIAYGTDKSEVFVAFCMYSQNIYGGGGNNIFILASSQGASFEF
jgi:hypothetical protein